MKELQYLNKYFYKYRGRLAVGIVFVNCACLCQIFPAQIMRDAINEVSRYFDIPNQTMDKSEIYQSVIRYTLLIIGLALLRGMFMFFMRQTIIVISRWIEYDMKNEIFSKYQQLNASFYSVNSTGDLMNRISEDVARVRMYVGPVVMYVINLTVTIVLTVYVMSTINWKLTLIVLTPLPVLVFIIYKVHDIINKRSDEVQEQLSNLSTFVQESFSGIRIIQSFAREKSFEASFANANGDYKKKSLSLARINALFYPAVTLLIGLSTILTIYFGGMAVIDGSFDIGSIAEFIMYVNMLTWPVASLGWIITLVQRAAASQQRINQFLNQTTEIENTNVEPSQFKGNIEFRNVSFTYKNSGIEAIKNCSFIIHENETVAITGKTGSGKSTIAVLLLRLYDCDSGEILIDGKNIKEINLDAWRKFVGYVPQEIFLFSDTISRNIAFGLDAESLSAKDLQQKIISSASDAAIDASITQFENGYETLLGERGINLSGGQKQRISIARALVKEPGLLLLDDCLSAVDTQTEEQIVSNIKRLSTAHKSIVISHRISTIKFADKILLLENGNLMAQGTHEDLLNNNALYFTIYNDQLIKENQELIS
ncbi:MAG: ABC transporter ATP-binding protein [Bacteroidetes bacterium]|nr:ABC transporter ATP-binding protein [Bacteroidota bacterium]